MYRRGKRGIWQISVGGVRQSSRTSDKERARRLELKLNHELWDRQNGITIPTWDQACLDWMKANPGKSEDLTNQHYLKWWKPKLTGKRLTVIDAGTLHDAIIKNRPGVSLTDRTKQNSTANNYVDFVAKIIRGTSNLKTSFQKYPPFINERWATPEEWFQIEAELSEDDRDVLTFALATGQREENVMFFEWAWWHKDYAVVPAGETKTVKPYGIPLNLTAQAILEKRSKAGVKHLRYAFTCGGEEWYRTKLWRHLKSACKRAKVRPLTVHAVRHTFGTWLARAGVAKDLRKRLMGHTTGDTHDRYIHHDVESLRPHCLHIDAQLRAKPEKQQARA